MNRVLFDVEALVRSIVIGLGVGFIVSAIAHYILKLSKGAIILLGIGIFLIVTGVLYFSWPSLIEVPDLKGLSRDQAELLLSQKSLVPEVRPQYSSEVERGRVIPHSQDPLPGIKVRKGTVVRFAVNIGNQQPLPKQTEESAPLVSIFRPRSGEDALCTRYGDGIYRFTVEGISKNISEKGLRLLLWVKPVSPPSETPSWYLQRPPINGILEIKPDGSWSGIGQIGNAQWPPHEGDVIDIAVTVVDSKTAKHLLGEPGVVTRISLPGIASDTASKVKIRLY